MNSHIKRQRNEISSEANEQSTAGNERTVRRARIAQLLGQLIFKRWQSERQPANKQNTKLE